MKAEERNMSEEMCLTDDDQLNPEQTVARETENAEEYSEEKEKRTSVRSQDSVGYPYAAQLYRGS